MTKGSGTIFTYEMPPRSLTFVIGSFLLLICLACTISLSANPEELAEPNVMKITETETIAPTNTIGPTATVTPDATATAQAISAEKLRIFDQFIQDNKNGNAKQITGLWVENKLALKVVYQPSSNPGFVSTVDNTATYFLYPWKKAGNHGFLAHNYLAGRYFFNVRVGDIITLIFGDGNYLDFEVTQIKSFQALQPNSPYSNFINLSSGEQLSANNLFIEVYMGAFHTTLQTCIANGSETEWGRQFTLAPPLY